MQHPTSMQSPRQPAGLPVRQPVLDFGALHREINAQLELLREAVYALEPGIVPGPATSYLRRASILGRLLEHAARRAVDVPVGPASPHNRLTWLLLWSCHWAIQEFSEIQRLLAGGCEVRMVVTLPLDSLSVLNDLIQRYDVINSQYGRGMASVLRAIDDTLHHLMMQRQQLRLARAAGREERRR